MDDQRLQRLIRMAMEAESLDGTVRANRDAPPGPISIVVWRRRLSWIGGGLAAAACLGVAAVVFRTPAPTGPGGFGRDAPIAIADPAVADEGARGDSSPSQGPDESPTYTTQVAAHHAEPEEAVVFAVFRGVDGSCECVQVDAPEWSGAKRLADVDRHELVRVAFRDPCSAFAPEVLVIGVSGKPGTVGSSRRHAEALAERLGRETFRGRDVSSAAYAALPDLPAGSLVVAEKISIGP
ncbi:MAG: hypothetical protein ACKVU4_10775 [Phycisphaerales bacterium]